MTYFTIININILTLARLGGPVVTGRTTDIIITLPLVAVSGEGGTSSP